MITNIIASIIISVVTNTIPVTEYWHEPDVWLTTYPAKKAEGYWSESPSMAWGHEGTRISPDKQYIEIRRIRTLKFAVEGKQHAIELENTLLKKIERNRKVETKETWEEKELPLPATYTNYIVTFTNTCISITNFVGVDLSSYTLD